MTEPNGGNELEELIEEAVLDQLGTGLAVPSDPFCQTVSSRLWADGHLVDPGQILKVLRRLQSDHRIRISGDSTVVKLDAEEQAKMREWAETRKRLMETAIDAHNEGFLT